MPSSSTTTASSKPATNSQTFMERIMVQDTQAQQVTDTAKPRELRVDVLELVNAELRWPYSHH
jgi:hypothetical protein